MLISKIIYAIDALTDYYFKKRVYIFIHPFTINIIKWWKVVCIRHTDTNQNSQFKHIRFWFFFGIKSKQWFNPETPKYRNKQSSGKHSTIWHDVTETMMHRFNFTGHTVGEQKLTNQKLTHLWKILEILKNIWPTRKISYTRVNFWETTNECIDDNPPTPPTAKSKRSCKIFGSVRTVRTLRALRRALRTSISHG